MLGLMNLCSVVRAKSTVHEISFKRSLGCFPTAQRSYSYGAPQACCQQSVPACPMTSSCGGQVGYAQPQALPPPIPQPGGYAQPAPAYVQPQSAGYAQAGGGGGYPVARVAAASNTGPTFIGDKVTLTEFTADGYNSEGGGPVQSGSALTCNFDGRPCCWANVPPPDDQIDWQYATGVPQHPSFSDIPAPEGSYLIAYAKGAAPSDEAQFASCSIGCSSSDIKVRVKHWQTEDVLLQVCLRESFPSNAEYNPLLNCQEIPPGKTLTTTEVVLPKTSLVDIVFVASSFVSEHGDMVILDDIEVSYERNGAECNNNNKNLQEIAQEKPSASHKQTIEAQNKPITAVLGEKTYVKEKGAGPEFEHLMHRSKADRFSANIESGPVRPASDRFGSAGFRGGEAAFKNRQKELKGIETEIEETVLESKKTASKNGGVPITKGAKTQDFSETVCQSIKCDFEDGHTCNYHDAHQTQSIRGLTTKFQVVSGQFMNHITGIKESIEGDFYAATFLFPREMAGLEVETDPFTERTRLRFQYYEGTHGVQLKGCCDSIENCPFSSDKFVSVADRVWKTSSFKCPKGTNKVIFLCENTRTNQGACAVDDLGIIEYEGPLRDIKPLC
ncbi:hypothetical protein WR25_26463 [Diploscapter pachys]|uniref:MAM domain-containing protein n=1 Tax=Diploscapter pachys TaxID=2018661 RepID=A0A2A2JDT9_9BILA|nr:hypothetical protein WR25_26463 [Diploscapter pachys]